MSQLDSDTLQQIKTNATRGAELIAATVGTTGVFGVTKKNTITVEAGNGKTTFEKIASTDPNKSPSGLDAAAWVDKKSEGKKNIEVSFPGFPGLTATPKQTESMYAVGDGKLYPQVLEVKAFMDQAIKKAGGKENIDSINISSHSMGSANATMALLVAKINGIPAKSIQLDPVGASLAAKKIEEGLDDPKSELYKQLVTDTGKSPEDVKKMLAESISPDSNTTVSIVSARVDDKEQLHTSRAGALIAGETREENNKIAFKPTDKTIINNQTRTDGNAPTGTELYMPMLNIGLQGLDPDPIHRLTAITNALKTDRMMLENPAQVVAGKQFGDMVNEIFKGIPPQEAFRDFYKSVANLNVGFGDGNTQTAPGAIPQTNSPTGKQK